MEDIERLFPRANEKPDSLLIQQSDFNRFSQKIIESCYIRVRFLVSPEDMVDLTACDPLLLTKGFVSECDSNSYSLLEMTEINQSAHPWLYVTGSRWFDSVPDSQQVEVSAKLEKMTSWDKEIFNYHPNWLPKEINTLNQILGYKYGFRSTVLTEPENPQQTAYSVDKTFSRIFERNAE